MKKEFRTLTFLSMALVLVYFLFPNFQENIKKDDLNIMYDEKQIVDSLDKKSLLEENIIRLTFDIVRISKHGDAVLAGKSEPNIYIELLNNNEMIANFFSDANGEWIWVSDLPLTEGIKKFKLQHRDKEGIYYKSDQTVVILNDKSSKSKPIVAKLLDSDTETIDMLNQDSIGNGLSLDLVNYNSSGLILLKGRTLPNHEVKFLNLNNIIGKSISNDFGKWEFAIKELELLNVKTIFTEINGEEISLPFSQVDLEEYVNVYNTNLEERNIVVEPGNSLWRIARKTLGGGIFYSEIYRNNLKRIKNPDLIYPGQVFNIPNIKKKILYE